MKKKYLTPQIITQITNGRYIGEKQAYDTPIRGAVRDNRDVRPGNLFICIKGARVDGHSFANSAYDAGAVCCLAETELVDAKGPYVLVSSTLEAIRIISEYYRNLFNIPVIGITGSVGKTTVKELISSVLSVKYDVLKTCGNLNNEIGVPLTLLSIDETHEVAVIEMGINDFGEMSNLAQMVRPDIFVMTKIGYAHIDTLGDLNGVLKAKTEVFKFMKTDGTAVLNGDDELLWEYDPGIKKITYGLKERNDYRIINVKSDGFKSISFNVLDKENKTYPVTVPAYGSHIIELVGAATAVGNLLDLTDEEIARGFSEYKSTEGRANIIKTEKITIIDDCYNANPNSVKAAIQSLSELPGRRVAILGDMLDMGESSDALHREIGAVAAEKNIDCLICCGDCALFIYEGFKNNNAHYFKSKEDLIPNLPELIKKDDAVLVKASNGMKFNEIVDKLK